MKQWNRLNYGNPIDTQYTHKQKQKNGLLPAERRGKEGAARAETGDFRLDAPKSFSRHLSFYTETNRDQAKMREDGRKRYLNGTMMKGMAERRRS